MSPIRDRVVDLIDGILKLNAKERKILESDARVETEVESMGECL